MTRWGALGVEHLAVFVLLAAGACGGSSPPPGDGGSGDGMVRDATGSQDADLTDSATSPGDAPADAPVTSDGAPADSIAVPADGSLPDATDSPGDGSPADATGSSDAPATKTYASSLAAGHDMACAISTSGALECWGAMRSPATLAPGSAHKQVAVGGRRDSYTGCAIRSDGTLWCWSADTGAFSQPDPATFKQVGVSLTNRCAIATTGALYCWGMNNLFGPLGVGDTMPRPSPTQVGSYLDWEHIAPSKDHTCGIRGGGALYCWGWNAFGEVGDGTKTQRNSPVAVDSANTYVDVDTKNVTSCGVRSDGTLACWGSGAVITFANTPTLVDSGTNWAKVRLSTGHACALKQDGSLYCWGSNDRGQLALPVTSANLSRLTPERVGSASDWIDVAVGDGFTCGLKQDNTVRCWGSNGSGQLAQSPPGHLTPNRIGAPGAWSHVTAGPNNVCAVRKNGELACWGRAGGMPVAGVPSQTPLTIGAATDWKTAKPGYLGACGTKTNDALYCWATGSSPAATSLTVSAYDVGYFHQCAIATGSLYCWGDGVFGKLGNGSHASLLAPTQVGLDTWEDVATSFDATCGIKTDGTLWCFGFGYTGIEKRGPATTWTSIEASPQGQTFYGLQGGTIYTWGSVPPVTPSGAITDWTLIAAGMLHVCGIRSNGTLWCQGYNDYAQLGDGTTVDKLSTMVQVGNASDWTSVTAGTLHTCGLRGAGDLYCWGSNDYGEMGDGTSWTSSPVVVP